MRTPFKVGSIIMFDSGMLGSLTSHGKLALVAVNGATVHPSRQPYFADYVLKDRPNTIIEPEEDYGSIIIDFGDAKVTVAA